jgi:4-alpha-glucanotransferase
VTFPRSTGILLHPTSLPGRFGIGDLGKEAHNFIDFLSESGQSLWQVLPLGPTGYGDSPYQCFSAFAGNALLVSPDLLVEDGLLDRKDIAEVPAFNLDRIEFGRVIDYKGGLLRKAFENFRRTTDTGLRSEFETFNQTAAIWLEDYALYRALKDARDGTAWNKWELPLVRRLPLALDAAREELHQEIEAHKFYQYLFFKQWSRLRAYCHERRVQIVGDIPIFVAHDSSDVWAHPEQFRLDERGNPRVVAGVPPDYFSKTGQLWGNPLYDWEQMKSDGFKWWIERVSATLRLVDILRIDHFRGFAAYWEVPGGDSTAERGRWVPAPGKALFQAVRKALGELPIIAEDLGVITPDVVALREEFKFPGMRILQFGFSTDARNKDLPHNYPPNSIVYTGTHDNDTIVGWFRSVAGEGSTRTAQQIAREHAFCTAYLDTDGNEIHWDFIRAALASVSNMALMPLQDVLGLGTEARMNLPASTSGNWGWRFRSGALTAEIANRLLRLTHLYGRDPLLEPVEHHADEPRSTL